MGMFAVKKNDNKFASQWSVGTEEKKSLNITVASWPAVGSTTLSLILSYIYDLKYFYSGAVFRYFSEKLGFSAEGKEYNRNEDKYGSYLDTLVDDYSKLLLEKGGYVISTKPLGYIIDREDTFRIFLYADMKSRMERSIKDGRESAETIEEGLKVRQKVAGDRFRKLYNFDWDDLDVIKASHECVIDTSNITISDEIEIITKKIEEIHSIKPKRTFIFGELSPTQIKEKALALMEEKQLELKTEQAINEMYDHFKDEINKRPQFIIDIFKKS